MPYRIRSKSDPRQLLDPRQEFGASLLRLLEAAKILPSHYGTFGMLIAQTEGESRPFPYGAHTINGWTTGELLPTLEAFTALSAVITRYSPALAAQNAALKEQFHEALHWQSKQPHHATEFSHALKTAFMNSGMSYDTLAEHFKALNHTPTPLLPATADYCRQMFQTCRQLVPSKRFTIALAEITPPLTPSILALHDHALRREADQLWPNNPNDFGAMLKACRVRLGESQPQFAKRLSGFIEKGTLVADLISDWETNRTFPRYALRPGEMRSDPIIAMMHAAEQSDPVLKAMGHPWFTAEKEAAMRAVKGRYDGYKPATTTLRSIRHDGGIKRGALESLSQSPRI